MFNELTSLWGNDNIPTMNYASVRRRLLAYLIDGMIAFGVVLVVLQSLVFPLVLQLFGEFYLSGPKIEIYTLLTISLPVWLYFAVLESREGGATLGKRLLGISVNTMDGESLSFQQALSRTILKLLPWEIAHVAINLPTNAWINLETGAIDPANAVMGLFRSGALLSVYLLAFIYVFMAWRSPSKQSLHDRIMNTVVLQNQS